LLDDLEHVFPERCIAESHLEFSFQKNAGLHSVAAPAVLMLILSV
jgi:hypothetical protein